MHHALALLSTRTGNRRRVDIARERELRAQRLRALGTVAAKVFTVVTLMGGLWFGAVKLRGWMLTSETFGLAEVHVTGHVRSTPGELELLGEVERGTNLFKLDTHAIERGIARHPWIKEVDLRRRFPNAISVRVVEHVPAAILSLQDLYLVDASGAPFKRLQPGDQADLPVISGLEREDWAQDAAWANARVRSALETAETYASLDLCDDARLSELRLEANGILLVTGSGQEVRLPEGDVDAALERLVRVRRELASRDLIAEVIHLDNRVRPDWVAIKVLASDPEKGGANETP